jgi:hypothetical protein
MVSLFGYRRPGAPRPPSTAVVWSVEPALVRPAAEIGLRLALETAPALEARLEERLSEPPPAPPSDDQLRLATAIAARTLAGLG